MFYIHLKYKILIIYIHLKYKLLKVYIQLKYKNLLGGELANKGNQAQNRQNLGFLYLVFNRVPKS